MKQSMSAQSSSSANANNNDEHPDAQSTVRSMISMRSVHNHEAIQLGELLRPGALPPRTTSITHASAGTPTHIHSPLVAMMPQRSMEHKSTQQTMRSVQDLFQEFERNNMEAIELAWKDLTVTSVDGGKTLLKGASGKVQGSFLAIMGPSGSGKTTLMNVLACRSGGTEADGTKVINGLNYSLTELKSVSGYVMQVGCAVSSALPHLSLSVPFSVPLSVPLSRLVWNPPPRLVLSRVVSRVVSRLV